MLELVGIVLDKGSIRGVYVVAIQDLDLSIWNIFPVLCDLSQPGKHNVPKKHQRH